MPTFLAWLLRFFGAPGIAGLAQYGGAVLAVALAAVKGLLEIVQDLMRTWEGRVILAALAFACAGWYVTDRYAVVDLASGQVHCASGKAGKTR